MITEAQVQALENVIDHDVSCAAMGVDYSDLFFMGYLIGERGVADSDEDWNYYWRLTPKGETVLQNYQHDQRIVALKAERDNWKHIADSYEASLKEISDTTSPWFCDCTPEEVEIVVAEYAETCEENRELKAIIAAVGYAIEMIAGIYLFPTEEIKKVANTLKQYKGK